MGEEGLITKVVAVRSVEELTPGKLRLRLRDASANPKRARQHEPDVFTGEIDEPGTDDEPIRVGELMTITVTRGGELSEAEDAQ